MEFLRFGSSIPGSYWGCCAIDIIQNFKVDPNSPAAIEIVGGDGGNSFEKFVGKTWKDIFWQRIRFGTFSTSNMANHAFIATLTDSQISSGYGKEWLKILHEAGFEFIRSVSNSVYQGSLISASADDGLNNGSLNHIFMLVRNVAAGSPKNAFKPPKAWLDLHSKNPYTPEVWDIIQQTGFDIDGFYKAQRTKQIADWKALPKAVWYTLADLTDIANNIWMAGRRSPNPQELKHQRDAKNEQTSKAKGKKGAEGTLDAFAA